MECLNGEGIDLQKYKLYIKHLKLSQLIIFDFFLITRMLWDKGIGEKMQRLK